MPSREENISSLGAAVQHNFRRTLLVPSREENISSLGAAVQHNLAPKYIGCQAKPQRVQWNPQRVQLHPLHSPGYRPETNLQNRTPSKILSGRIPLNFQILGKGHIYNL